MGTRISKELVEIEGLYFVKYIDSERIREKVKELAEQINQDFSGSSITCLVVLKGAYMFACDLLREIKVDCTIHFIQAKSYNGIKQEEVFLRIPKDIEIQNENVLIIEDIVDTANTVVKLKEELERMEPKQILLASLLSKPNKHQHNVSIDYQGFEIADKFVVGYGLDYNQQGRNMNNIYQLRQDSIE